MESIQIRCPNADCGKRLLVPLDAQARSRKVRCPACRTAFEVALAPPKPAPRPAAADDEDDGGSYGLAPETSLTYLLRREADGHRLTPEDKAAKKRLIAERLAASPRQCPSCERPMAKGAVVCVGCGLNLKTGKLLKTKVEAAPPEISDDSGSDGGSGVAGGVAEVIINILASG